MKETDRQTDRQTDTQTHRHTDRETERERQTERLRERETDRETDRQREWERGREREIERETERQTDRRTDRQTDRSTLQQVQLFSFVLLTFFLPIQACGERHYSSYKDLFSYLFESLDTDVKKAWALLSWLSANCHHWYNSNGQVTTKIYKEATDPNTPVGAIKLRCIHRDSTDRLTKERFFAVLCRQVDVLITDHSERCLDSH